MPDINDELTTHHRALEDLLEKWNTHRHHNKRHAQAVFDTFAEQLEHHIEIEEEIIFPEYESQFAASDSIIPMLIQQHRQLLERLEVIGERTTESYGGTESGADSFRRLLDVHNATEEYTLYPWLNTILDPVANALVVSLLDSFDGTS